MTFNKKIVIATVGLIALSCVTIPTDDINITTSQTSISLSLTESRTVLGEKVDDAYPLYWSKGDKISANGIESAEAIIDENNPARATFNFNGALDKTIHIAYPAAPEGKVIFATEQTHINNSTFSNGASTMYGVVADKSVELRHLTGVLKLGIIGSATLTKVQISTVDETPYFGNIRHRLYKWNCYTYNRG